MQHQQMIFLHVINELNTSYRFAKFTLNKQNAIDISTSLAFSEPNFNPALVFEHTRMLYKLANDEYKKLNESYLSINKGWAASSPSFYFDIISIHILIAVPTIKNR